jgi:hypothetical protein
MCHKNTLFLFFTTLYLLDSCQKKAPITGGLVVYNSSWRIKNHPQERHFVDIHVHDAQKSYPWLVHRQLH